MYFEPRAGKPWHPDLAQGGGSAPDKCNVRLGVFLPHCARRSSCEVFRYPTVVVQHSAHVQIALHPIAFRISVPVFLRNHGDEHAKLCGYVSGKTEVASDSNQPKSQELASRPIRGGYIVTSSSSDTRSDDSSGYQGEDFRTSTDRTGFCCQSTKVRGSDV